MTFRKLDFTTAGMPATDGAGVSLTRLIGTPYFDMLDPFLMLDVFESDDPDDYIAGFPDHPHRGFETVTYLLAGKMRHRDNAGNEGVILPGGVQWMTAGKGIVHSEMPEQTDGLLRGFQFWVNLPQKAKMTDPGYQEFPPESIKTYEVSEGVNVHLIAGKLDTGEIGPVTNVHTHPVFMDVSMKERGEFIQSLPSGHNAFLYGISGDLLIGDEKLSLSNGHVGVLSQEGDLKVAAGSAETRFLLAAGKPLKEPVVKGGPFVMNTRVEVLQAYDDYRSGQF